MLHWIEHEHSLGEYDITGFRSEGFMARSSGLSPLLTLIPFTVISANFLPAWRLVIFLANLITEVPGSHFTGLTLLQ
jgi:hypothetical protein